MVYFEKSQPAPDCLETEKTKAKGDYKCSNVLERIKTDFKNKCYICEYAEPTTINVEHFIPHKEDKELKFDWNNLFWSCGHCNNTKLASYTNILNCTDSSEDIENKLKYVFRPFPFEKVQIIELDSSPKTLMTKKLLDDVYNGTTKLKNIESANLRNKLLEEIREFQDLLCEYFKEKYSPVEKEYFLVRIKGHINRGSNFTAFKRWIILENETLKKQFELYFK